MKIFFKKSKGWCVDVTIAGERVRESGFSKKKSAEDFVVELRALARQGKFGLEPERPRVTLAELVAERILDVARRPSGRPAKRKLEAFAKMFPAGFLIDDVGVGHLREWVKPWKRAGLKPETINSYLAHVAGMFAAAPALFPELGEDWTGPKIPWEKISKRGRERVISREEERQLLEALRFPGKRKDGEHFRPQIIAARREIADCFELALLTGMRGKEVRSLEWSEVDLADAEAHLPATKTKTREPRDVLLNGRAIEILRRRLELRSGRNRFVFPGPDGTRPRLPIAPVVRRVARDLGLRYGRNLDDGFAPHDTRHTATTRMLRAGRDIKTVQDILGHSDRTMTLRYGHSTRASRREAVEGLVDREDRGGTRQKVDKAKSG